MFNLKPWRGFAEPINYMETEYFLPLCLVWYAKLTTNAEHIKHIQETSIPVKLNIGMFKIKGYLYHMYNIESIIEQ